MFGYKNANSRITVLKMHLYILVLYFIFLQIPLISVIHNKTVHWIYTKNTIQNYTISVDI